MQVSVALCTYNGAEYLPAQLDSFLSQSRKIDELIICDDCSTDETQKILKSFIEVAPFPVKLHINKKNIGSTGNFENAISLCTGDLIALSDQDDIWFENKLESLARVFEQSESIGAVFSDAIVVDASLVHHCHTLWQYAGLTLNEQREIHRDATLSVLLRHQVVTGATLMFRSRYREFILPIPSDWVHDAWIATMLATCASIKIIDSPLIYYRQHSTNQLGVKWIGFLKHIESSLTLNWEAYYLYEIEKFDKCLKKLATTNIQIRPNAINQIESKINHLKYRGNFPRSRILRIPFILYSLTKFDYFHYSAGWKVAIRDFLLSK
jgi:glycosyltransferase involved in cell wall biosynthesis